MEMRKSLNMNTQDNQHPPMKKRWKINKKKTSKQTPGNKNNNLNVETRQRSC